MVALLVVKVSEQRCPQGLGQPHGHLGDALLSWILRRVGFSVAAVGTRSCWISG